MKKKRRILLVDDESDITAALNMALEDYGFEVDSYNDPLAAVSNFKPSYYNLVILDIKMPDMDGFELYRQIRMKDNRVKACFLTAVSEFRDYEQYKKEAYPKLGERYFIVKPVPNDELIRRINEILK